MDRDALLGRPERWANILGWATLAGLEFGLIGPFGSYSSHIFTRILYWTGLFWIGALLLWPCVVLALLVGPRRGFPPVFSAIAALLLACIPLAAFGAAETHLFWPARASAMRIAEWYGLTLVVALPAMAALVWLQLWRTGLLPAHLGRAGPSAWQQPVDRRPAALPAPPSPTPSVPDHLLAGALCLQMEDHHVRVHLHGRSVLHHAVLRDVVAALDERRGLQVHRSWWVARDAVRGWERDGRSISLLLANGLRVPVARQRVALLRARGWLDDEG